MHDAATIGARLHALRRWRGMTLTQLGGQAGLSASFLSRAERGERMLDRRSHIAALASALRISETELTGGPHLGANELQSGPHRSVPLMREALTGGTITAPAVDRARPLADIEALLVGEIQRCKEAADYQRRGELVAPVIAELQFWAATGGERDRARALRLLIEASNAAGMTLRHLAYRDLAYVAAAQALEAAAALDDPVMSAQADYLRVMTMPKPTSWQRPLELAARAADRIQGLTRDTAAAETYGMLHLTAALSAAAVHDGARARDHLAEAAETAGRLGERETAWASFGPTNVAIWGIAVHSEHGDYDRAVSSAVGITTGHLPNRERRAWFHADLGRAMAHIPQRRDQAVRQFEIAEQIAPQRIRNSSPVQGAVLYLLGQHTTASPGRVLRGMAARMGVAH